MYLPPPLPVRRLTYGKQKKQKSQRRSLDTTSHGAALGGRTSRNGRVNVDLIPVVLERRVGDGTDLGGVGTIDGGVRGRQHRRHGPHDRAGGVRQAAILVRILQRRAGVGIHRLDHVLGHQRRVRVVQDLVGAVVADLGLGHRAGGIRVRGVVVRVVRREDRRCCACEDTSVNGKSVNLAYVAGEL